MRAILIRDGETDPATDDLASAIRDIYPSLHRRGVASPRRGKRIISKLAAVAPALPPTESLLPPRLAPA